MPSTAPVTRNPATIADAHAELLAACQTHLRSPRRRAESRRRATPPARRARAWRGGSAPTSPRRAAGTRPSRAGCGRCAGCCISSTSTTRTRPTRCPWRCSTPTPLGWPTAAGTWNSWTRSSRAATPSRPGSRGCRAVPPAGRCARPEHPLSSDTRVPAPPGARALEFHLMTTQPTTWRETLAAGDIVAFRFPCPDDPAAEKSRPCLVVEVDRIAGEAVVVYGTSRWTGPNRGRTARHRTRGLRGGGARPADPLRRRAPRPGAPREPALRRVP
jgi:hypothetical protein